MADRPAETIRSGDALFAFAADLTIVSWNGAAEALTGVSAEEAIGRYCWEVLGGHDECGNLICHPGCSTARLAREGWPVSCHDLLITARQGKRRVAMSTVTIDDVDAPRIAHVMVPHGEHGPGPSVAVSLTPRQQQVLRLLADGIPAKVIATRLGLAEDTVRNHIRAILAALETHSQLEAIAKARRLQLIA
jgi:DNA-binding CsgD family transcriptional regulator